MRATTDAREFADVRSRNFLLDSATQEILMRVAAAKLLQAPVLSNATR